MSEPGKLSTANTGETGPVPESALAAGRGRRAERPRDIPFTGWRDIVLRIKEGLKHEHVSIAAAGIAFYALLAILPALATLISIWGLLFDPAEVSRQIEQVSGALPDEAASIIKNQARELASKSEEEVTAFAAVAGFLLTLYSASKGVKALIEGLNITYEERETRNLVQLNLVALGLTLVLIVGFLLSLSLIAVLPAVLNVVGLDSFAEHVVVLLRWPLLFGLAIVGLAALYRFAPCRRNPRWTWVSWGAVLATTLWMIGSILFSLYVRHFASYNETYGTLGAVVILLMWLWLSAYIVLLGAELNAEMEHQTARDTTAGRDRPMGERGAHVADTLGDRM